MEVSLSLLFLPIILVFGSCISHSYVTHCSHCHIDWHVVIGMIAQFVEAPDVMQKTLQVPQKIYDQCSTNQCKKFQHWDVDQNYVQGNVSKGQDYAHGKDEEDKDKDKGAQVQFHFSLWEQFINWVFTLLRL